jgi:hypothetical protein
MASVKAALVTHGRALDVLAQDVRQLRSEMDRRFDEVLSGIRGLAPRDPT